MRLATLAVVTAAALGGVAAPAQAIVGGKPVPPGQDRFVANIDIAGSFGCSGTLIAPQWVMTAGHCGSLTGSLTDGLLPTAIAYPPSDYDVKLGSVYTNGSGAEDHAVTQVVIDSSYFVTNGSGNDVTLLKLDTPTTIPPVQIAAVGERSTWEPGVLETIDGFGTTSESASTPPPQMQTAQVPITTDAYCAAAYPNGFGPLGGNGSFDAGTEVCAGYPQGGTDTCSGDSGGPLLATLPDGALRLVGATSFGQGCAEAGHPGVYARVAEGPIRSFVASVVPAALAPEPSSAGVAGSSTTSAPAPKPSTAATPKSKPKKHKKHKKHRAAHSKSKHHKPARKTSKHKKL